MATSNSKIADKNEAITKINCSITAKIVDEEVTLNASDIKNGINFSLPEGKVVKIGTLQKLIDSTKEGANKFSIEMPSVPDGPFKDVFDKLLSTEVQITKLDFASAKDGAPAKFSLAVEGEFKEAIGFNFLNVKNFKLDFARDVKDDK